nr:DddA-like double-stranded DNA deaminase toxin [Salinispora arenicola]
MKGFPWTLTDHVESRAAQQMRRPGAPREVSLVVNKEPCTDDPYGCDRILRHIIPAGSRLTIYVQDPEAPAGVRTVGQYEGTGRGIVL